MYGFQELSGAQEIEDVLGPAHDGPAYVVHHEGDVQVLEGVHHRVEVASGLRCVGDKISVQIIVIARDFSTDEYGILDVS